MMKHVTHWIGGKSWDGPSERQAMLCDPARGVVSGVVDLASAREVDMAVDTARSVFPAWRDSSLSRRANVLFSFRERLIEAREDLARLIVSEHGKVFADALGEVDRGIEVVEFACGIPHLLKGSHSQNVSTRVDSHSVRHPLGVVVGITPFNFPVMVPLWMVPVAIACGNTFILKPSEKDPSASALLGSLLAEAGLPDGVFNVIHGDREAVDALLEHPGVDAVSFVGSTPVARHVYATATAAGKRVQALGGAKNHMVVLPDADVDAAADAAVSAAFGSAGERCMAISVLVAVDPVGDRVVEAVESRLREIRVGDGSTPESDMGPLVTEQHRDRVADYVDRAASEGATVRVDGRRADNLPEGDGFWLGPCLVDHVATDMSVYRDEIFGPVLSVVRVASYDEALAVVNAHEFGNGAAVFTNDGAAARRFELEAEAGMVGVNVPIPVPMSYYSFGGWKGSFYGDTRMHGPEGVRFYTREKVVTTRWEERSRTGVDLLFPRSH